MQLAIVSQRLERSSHGAAGGTPSVRKLVPSGEQIGEHVVVGINLVELGPRLARVSEAHRYHRARGRCPVYICQGCGLVEWYQGKTNLLEAIFVVAALRSFRTAKLFTGAEAVRALLVWDLDEVVD